jgi:hypothetical protein
MQMEKLAAALSTSITGLTAAEEVGQPEQELAADLGSSALIEIVEAARERIANTAACRCDVFVSQSISQKWIKADKVVKKIPTGPTLLYR